MKNRTLNILFIGSLTAFVILTLATDKLERENTIEAGGATKSQPSDLKPPAENTETSIQPAIKGDVHLLSGHHLSAESVDNNSFEQSLVTIAELGFKRFVEKIPEEDLQLFGFSGKEEAFNSKITKPVPVYTIDPQTILNFSGKPMVDQLLIKTNVWYFPVEVDGVFKSITVVDKVGEKWKVVSLGLRDLAHELDLITQRWSSFKLVKQNQLKEYLFFVPEKGSSNLTSIDSRNKASNRYEVLGNAAEQFEYMKSNIVLDEVISGF